MTGKSYLNKLVDDILGSYLKVIAHLSLFFSPLISWGEQNWHWSSNAENCSFLKEEKSKSRNNNQWLKTNVNCESNINIRKICLKLWNCSDMKARSITSFHWLYR